MKKRFADVIIDISHEKVDRPFQYKIPDSLQEILEVGMCVRVPFGKGNHLRMGYVVDMTDTPDYPEEKIKQIDRIETENLPAEARSIRLAGWMKHHYGGTMIQAIKTVLPVKQEVKAVVQREVSLAVSHDEACCCLADAKAKHQVGKVRLLEALLPGATVSYSLLTGKLSVSPQTIKSLERQGVLRIDSFEEYRNPIRFAAGAEVKKKLTPRQQEIAEGFLADYDGGDRTPALLFGVTGSGKTEVYMEVIEGMLARGKQVIVLIPEIALTYQTVLRFYRRFGDVVSVINSRLSAGEKYDQLRRAKEGKVKVMIGPRSALFTPFEHLGLIVIDEEHEPVYKSDTMPKYHAREVAIQIAKMTDAAVLMGSATPSLEANYKAMSGEYKKYELKTRIGAAVMPKIEVVDMMQELRQKNMGMFSRRLQEEMRNVLAKGEQIMLFLNRRGISGLMSCRACGYVYKCPHCDVALSQHRNKMVCHYCGYEQPRVTNQTPCPECGKPYVRGFKMGTEKVEEYLTDMFPGARILRMDADTTRQKGDYEAILSAFSQGEADILLGTQMIVKGHDFKNVTLVGVLMADISMYEADYRAGERTFQILSQAAGRAGRGEKPGIAVIQTYKPDHYCLQHCITQDYDAFYEEEMAYRMLMDYPPAYHMLAVMLTGEEEKRLDSRASMLADALKKSNPDVRIIGPAPASIGKINDKYRQIIYIKHAQTDVLIRVKDRAESIIKANEMLLKEILITFDMDPVHAY
ncbi:MAG: primosomal protein N' [Lachnospiraceae bacterium]|nr:primosomal protein N' [Lachnospiraceae bacterium]